MSAPAGAPDTLVTLVRQRAQDAPDGLAYGFLVDGDRDLRTLTYGELETEARRVASLVAARVAPGGRAVLVFEPGLDFLVAFFGCLFAGVVAVPVYPPAPPQIDAGVASVERIIRDARAQVLLISRQLSALADAMPGLRERLGVVPWIVTDDAHRGDPASWRDPLVRPAALAFLQYTSGSTAEPRGVALRHENLLAQERAIDWFVRDPTEATVVSWLPLYHDMGLIGTVLWPLHRGVPCYLLSPLHFLQRPGRWLEAMSRYRGTISGGPSFAYDLCVRRVSEETRSRLDLSSWDVAFNGAEPLRADTVRRFETRFAPCGLRPGTVVGCYGLAEASLLVTGAHREGARFVSVDRAELAADRVVRLPAGDPRALELVSCGGVPPAHDVRIVDPDTGIERARGGAGEIWFRGPSVGEGYWNRPLDTATTFGATLAGAGDPAPRYLRTGDLGFLLDGRLYVTGRLKDLIVVRGRNVHPQDVEEAAQRADPRLRPGRGVAVPVPTDEGEGVGLIQETTISDPEELANLARFARRAVLESSGVTLAVVYLVASRSVLRTTSGKLRRRATGAALAAGELTVLREDADASASLPVGAR
jgi:acyl-CoA synthetase (AMP-forming)/AMP-acid ligase II